MTRDEGPQIGDRVRATMNGQTWFTGTLEERSEVFIEYGVRRDDLKSELRFFTHAEKLEEKK